LKSVKQTAADGIGVGDVCRRRTNTGLPPRAAKRYSIGVCTGSELRMNPFLWLITTLISLYIWILIAAAVLSWLVAFNVANPHNQIVRAIGNGLYAMTEPALRPIRSVLPNLGGLDLSPVILILLLLFVERLLFWIFI